MGLGARLREARHKQKLTQKEIARRVSRLEEREVTQSKIGTLESRDTKKSDIGLSISQALNIGYIWLSLGEGEMQVFDVEKIDLSMREKTKEPLRARIYKARRDCGKTIEEIAEFCETNEAIYRSWEFGHGFPSYYQLCLFSKITSTESNPVSLKPLLYGYFSAGNESKNANSDFPAIVTQSSASRILMAQIAEMEASGDLDEEKIQKLTDFIATFRTSKAKPDAAERIKKALE